MDKEEKKLDKKRVLKWVVGYAALLMALVLILNLNAVNRWISGILLLLRPVLIGLGVSYLLNPIFRFLERNILHRLRPQGLRRAISLILSYLFLLIIIALILLLIVPQLIDSILTFLGNYNQHISSAIAQVNRIFASINSLIERFTENGEFLEYLNEAEIRKSAAELFSNLDKASKTLTEFFSGLSFSSLQSTVSNAVAILTDAVLGLFVSIYFLSTKEKRYAQIMKARRALFSDLTNERITRICTIADRSFGGFLEGKLLDSLIVGALIYVFISIVGVPYAILIATFMAIANIIPILGPLIGAVPTSLIILLSDPAKVLPFLLIVIVIQQIDNNIISPKILGSNTGVSSLCVVIAVAVMGDLWGIWGLLLGVPLFATVLEMTDELVVSTLQKRGFPSGVANYYANDAVVDPAKNAHITTDKMVQRFEKHAMTLRRREENGEQMSRKERFTLTVYRLAHKYHILSEMKDETHARYSAEQATKEAEMEAEELLEAHRNAQIAAILAKDEEQGSQRS